MSMRRTVLSSNTDDHGSGFTAADDDGKQRQAADANDFTRAVQSRVGDLNGSLLQGYEVGIVVDCHEKISNRQRSAALCDKLVEYGIRATSRQLPVGDFLLVALPRPVSQDAEPPVSSGGPIEARTGAAPALPAQVVKTKGKATKGKAGPSSSCSDEWLVLDTVIERKAMSDFLSTVRSGRHYHSQKVESPISRLGRPHST